MDGKVNFIAQLANRAYRAGDTAIVQREGEEGELKMEITYVAQDELPYLKAKYVILNLKEKEIHD
jgi:hypothetical protein